MELSVKEILALRHVITLRVIKAVERAGTRVGFTLDSEEAALNYIELAEKVEHRLFPHLRFKHSLEATGGLNSHRRVRIRLVS